MSDITMVELLKKADDCASSGVPVDWRKLCYTVFSAANQAAIQQEKRIEELLKQINGE